MRKSFLISRLVGFCLVGLLVFIIYTSRHHSVRETRQRDEESADLKDVLSHEDFKSLEKSNVVEDPETSESDSKAKLNVSSEKEFDGGNSKPNSNSTTQFDIYDSNHVTNQYKLRKPEVIDSLNQPKDTKTTGENNYDINHIASQDFLKKPKVLDSLNYPKHTTTVKHLTSVSNHVISQDLLEKVKLMDLIPKPKDKNTIKNVTSDSHHLNNVDFSKTPEVSDASVSPKHGNTGEKVTVDSIVPENHDASKKSLAVDVSKNPKEVNSTKTQNSMEKPESVDARKNPKDTNRTQTLELTKHLETFRSASASKNSSSKPSKNSSSKTPPFVFIVCAANDYNKGRQLEQVFAMLKSAAMLTRTTLRFTLLTNSDDISTKVTDYVATWPSNLRDRLSLSVKEVWYPLERLQMIDLYHTCATERLFIPQILSDEPLATFIDTDVLFMQAPEDLWPIYGELDEDQEISVGSFMKSWRGQKANRNVPIYGPTGINAGVMLMKIGRMRERNSTAVMLRLYDEYADRIYLADQDILNIYLSKHPERHHALPCAWNLRAESACWEEDASVRCGQTASLLHGIENNFIANNEWHMRAQFEVWKQQPLEGTLQQLYGSLRTALLAVNSGDQASSCAKDNATVSLFLSGLEARVAREAAGTPTSVVKNVTSGL